MVKFINFSGQDLIKLLALSQERVNNVDSTKANKHLTNYRYLQIAIIVCCLLNGLSLAFMPFMVGQLIKELATKASLEFLQFAYSFIALIFVHSLTSIILELLLYNFSITAIAKLRQNLFTLFNYQNYANANNLTSGELNNNLLLHLDYLAQGIEMYYKQFYIAVFSLIFSFAIMLRLNIYLTLIIVCLSPLAFLVTRFISQNTYRYFNLAQQAQAKQSSQVAETVQAIMRIKQQGNQNYCINTFNQHNNLVKQYWQSAIFFSSLANPLNRILNNVIYILVALFGLIFLQMGQLNLASLTAFLTYTNEFSKPFSDLNGVLAELEKAKVALNSLQTSLKNIKLENLESTNTKLTTEQATSELKAEHINFSYTADREILHDVTFNLKAGQTLAIVGPSGSGKSTIINLLMQFYQPNSGLISYAGKAASSYPQALWREHFAMVLQDSFVFYGTIRENLLFANGKATEAEMWQACEQAELASFIKRLPKQLDTVIGTGALQLSFSQMQLLSLARLFLRPSQVILLDEASSAVDCFSEVKIQTAIRKLSQTKSLLVVAHRLVTIANADLILLVKNGCIQERGTHAELLKAKGLYAKLWQAQYPLASGQ